MTLFEGVSAAMRRLHYSPKTEEAYLHWARDFVQFHGNRHPRDLGKEEITAWLNDRAINLAINKKVAASTQNQALCAVVFLYRRVLEMEFPELDELDRAQRPGHLPEVMSAVEVRKVLEKLGELGPPYRLIGELLYGSGLRLSEGLNLRVKDVDFERCQLMVRRGKGDQDRGALLPKATAGARRSPTGSLVTKCAER